MKFVLFLGWFVSAVFVFGVSPLQAQPAVERPITPGTPSAIPLRIKQVEQGLYMITGRGGNSVVMAEPDGLVLVDTKVMYDQVWRELLGIISDRIGEQPIRYAVVTHHHADHSGNNARVLELGAPVIGHESLVPILQNYTSRIAPVNPAAPSVTFSGFYEFVIGGQSVQLYNWGPGHTLSDTVVYFPGKRAVAVGDMLYGSGELAVDAIDGHGSLLGTSKNLGHLLELDFDIAIPGHGDNVLTRQEVVLYKQRLDSLIERGRAAILDGVSPTDFVASLRTADLGFRLVGHFWTELPYFAPIYLELSAEVDSL